MDGEFHINTYEAAIVTKLQEVKLSAQETNRNMGEKSQHTNRICKKILKNKWKCQN